MRGLLPWSARIGLTWLLLTSTAHASFQYVFDQASYSVNPGGAVDVKVYLQETTAGTSVLNQEGLFSAGVRVLFNLPPLPSSPSQITSLSNIQANSSFNDRFGPVEDLVPGISAGLSEDVDLADPVGAVFPTRVNATTYQILLGTFRFTAGSSPGTTMIEAQDLSPSTNDTLTGATGTVLDPSIQVGTAAIIVGTIVPEPASLVMMGTGLLGVVYTLSRRKKAA